MMYKSKRTANIRAKTRATLFKLDRTTFNIVIRQRNLKKRKTVLEILKKIDIFK
jgi:CRP-like cAMP-binding protein